MKMMTLMRKLLLVTLALGCTNAAIAKTADVYVYRGAGCTGRDRMASFTRLLGRPARGVTEFTEQSDWSHMLTSVRWALGCWRGTPYRLSQSVPMLMAKDTSLKQGAAGAYDRHFVALGKLLVEMGHSDAYLRIGWEFNGGWYPWAAAHDPDAFKAYFRRIVAALRTVPGQKFRVVWNPAQGTQQIDPERVYPGDDVVDVVALDLYNQSWRPQDRLSAQLRWQNLVDQPYGLAWLRAFATRHRKPIALPEWGTGTRPDGHGFVDDPLFIANMAKWIAVNNVVYHGYWDYKAGDYDAELSTGRQPKAAAAFTNAFSRAKR
jgi:Glycosyl hydrolase family 26